MAFQGSITVSGGSIAINSNETFGAMAQLEESIADSTTDQLVSINIKHSTLALFAIVSTVAMTVKTNSSSSPQETLTLTANKPIVWGSTMPDDPISGDVSALYVTNSSGSAGTIKAIAGWDPTT